MISYLKGKVIFLDLKHAVIDVGGVGYKVYCPTETIEYLTRNKESVGLWIYTSVREDALDLYGFVKKEDLDLFELLITVSGIGPKTASTIISAAGSETIREAIHEEDPNYLTKVSGVGKKNAEKIVHELKDKLGARSLVGGVSQTKTKDSTLVVEALLSLGYNEREAREALKKIPKDLTTEEQIKFALKNLN